MRRSPSPYEAEIRRAEERVLVDRVMWLATGAPNGQVRADRGLEARQTRSTLEERSGGRRGGAGPARAAGRRYQALPGTAGRSRTADAGPGRAARRADRRRFRHGLAGACAGLQLEQGAFGLVDYHRPAPMMNKTRIRCLGASWAIALAMLPCGLAAQDNSGHAHAQAEAA